MKIIFEITPEKRLTLEAPLESVREILQAALKAFDAVHKPDAGWTLPRFIVSHDNGGKSCSPREIVACDAFTAAEVYADLTLPNMPGPWTHTDRDFEKLKYFGARFKHRVKSASGKSLRVIVEEVE